MEKVRLTDGVYWVGAIDWNLRNFHGYSTRRGTTYNAYLVVDEKVALIDTVKRTFSEEMFERIEAITDPAKIDYVISNHTEMDHSGSLPQIMSLAKNATVITSEKFGESAIAKHFQRDWTLMPVKDGSELDLGRRRLKFTPIPMVHWPDSMCTYLVEDKILFSNDAFGQHLATSCRFDDKVDWSIAEAEAVKYYANIVMPLRDPVLRALDKLKGLDINIIAPSHGLIWRSNVVKMIENYANWAKGEAKNKALVVYDTMYGSTEKMAKAILDGICMEGMEAKLYDLAESDWSDIVTEVLHAKAVIVGSATINNCMLGPVAGFLNYLKGLRPRGKVGAAFGSYGWGGGAVRAIEQELKSAGIALPDQSLSVNFVPTAEELQKCVDLGRAIAAKVKQESA